MQVGLQLEERSVRTGPVPELVGRSGELTRLRERILRPPPGAPRATLLTGEPGIGRTRLVEELRSTLPDTVRVLQGAGDPLQPDRPFGAIGSAVSAARAGAVDGFVEEVLTISRRSRVLLVVEDLQWADPGSLAVVRELVAAGPATLSVLATLRDGARPAPVRQLVAVLVPRQLELLRLAPLPEDAVEALVTDMVRHRPDGRFLSHVAGAGGNPGFVVELVTALAQEGSLRHVDDGAGDRIELVDAELPVALRETLVRRLDTLPRSSMDTLVVASLVGTTFDLEDLAIVLDLPVSEVVARLRDPVDAGWVEARGPQLAFRHELVRLAVHDDAPPAARRALRRQIARRLLDAGRSAPTVHRHLPRRARGDRTVDGRHDGNRQARPLIGWAALTPTERTVAALAADGLTNPEIGARLFVSRRTVQTHLSHVYAKLGLGSRVELAAAAARLDAVG